LRNLEEALITWHKEEMVSIAKNLSKEPKSANQDITELTHMEFHTSSQDVEQTSSEFTTPAIASVDTFRELVYAPSSVAHMDEKQDTSQLCLSRGQSGDPLTPETDDQLQSLESDLKPWLHPMFHPRHQNRALPHRVIRWLL